MRLEVAAVRRQQAQLPVAVPCETAAVVAADCLERGFLQRDRAGKPHVMFRATHADRWSNQRTAQAQRDLLTQPRAMLGIHEQRQMRTVLLDGTARDDDCGPAVAERLFHLGPAQTFEEQLI